MDKKMIVIDLDGTLLTKENLIPSTTIDYLNSLITKGHIIVLASGRPYRSIMNFAKNFPANLPIISENGAFIGSLDKSLSTIIKSFKKDVFLKLFTENKEIINNAFYSVFDYAYIYNYTPKLNGFYHIDKDTKVIEKSYDEIEDLLPPNGILFIIKSEFRNKFEEYIDDNFSGSIKYRCMGYDTKNAVYEVSQSVISKAYAIEKLLKHYDLSNYDLIAIGDGENDIDMLKIAKVSVAMKNASNIVKQNASFITEYDNNNEGVRCFLENYFSEN